MSSIVKLHFLLSEGGFPVKAWTELTVAAEVAMTTAVKRISLRDGCGRWAACL